MLPDDWTTTANVVRETGKRELSVSSCRKANKESWWWNEEVQEYVQTNRLAQKKWNTESLYRKMQHKVKVEVAKA